MNKLLWILGIILCFGSFETGAQERSVPKILKATLISDSSNKTNVKGQATIAIGRGRDFPRPRDQFNKTLSTISEQMNNTSGVYVNEYAGLKLGSSYLLEIPFVIITSEEKFTLTADETENVKRYLENGGFIYGENTLATSRNSPAEQSFKKMIRETIGKEARFSEINKGHSLFGIFNDFPDGAPILRDGPIVNTSPLLAVKYKGRIVAIFSNRPYTLAWNRPAKNTLPLKFAVNMIIFALQQHGGLTIRN